MDLNRPLRQLAWRASRWIMGLCLCLFALPVQAELALTGEWLPGGPGIDAHAIATGSFDGRFEPFDPTLLRAFPRNPDGVWIRLRPAAGPWPAQALALLVRHPSVERVTLYRQAEPALSLQVLRQAPADLEPGYGRLHFPLSSLDGPLLLRLEPLPQRPASLRFAVVSHGEFVLENGRWLAFASACFAIMLAMAIVALCFATLLRDITFLYYAGYGLCFCSILLLQSGFLVHPLGVTDVWQWFSPVGRAVTALSVLFAVLFLDRFATLRRYAPRGRWLALGLAGSVVTLMLAGAVPWAPVQQLPSVLINPLLALGAPLILSVALQAWWRGSRYAGIFVLGWSPLLILTMLDSASLPALAGVTWLGTGMLAAGAFEALVLSLGLAGRSLALRHERDLARILADTDPLTALLNRRAWGERLDPMLTRARATREPLSVLFLDLDYFKRLNDSQGHEAGDRALRLLAQLIHAEVLPQGLAGRYGGEEFVVALPGSDAAAALAIGERIRAALRRAAVRVDDHGALLDSSVGVAELRRGDTAASLLRRADEAMYAHKQSRRAPGVTEISRPAGETSDPASGALPDAQRVVGR
ncbi:MAG: diguanylate cyclase [Lysobacterales bacterium]